MIERIPIKDHLENTLSSHFRDTFTKKEYRRVMASIAWPCAKPGFILIAGESRIDRNKKRDIDLIFEFESWDMAELFKMARVSQRYYWIGSYYGNPHNETMYLLWIEYLRQHEKRHPREVKIGEVPINIIPVMAPGSAENQMSLYIPIILAYLQPENKTLHINECGKVRAAIEQMQQVDELKSAKASDLPPIAALGYIVAALQMYEKVPYQPEEKEEYMPLDAAAGY